MVDTIDGHLNEDFRVVTGRDPCCRFGDPERLGVRFSDRVVIARISLGGGLANGIKKLLDAAIAGQFQGETAIWPQDVPIDPVEVEKENESSDNGVAQYA